MIRATINHQTYDRKPSDDRRTQREIIQGLVAESGTVQELAEDVVQPKSKTWCPAVFEQNGVRDNKHWRAQQVFAIDIDNKVVEGRAKKEIELTTDDRRYLSPSAALARCREYGVMPVFFYTTFSSRENHQRYRMVFLSPVEITDPRVRDVIQSALMKVFPESDPSCKDRSRMFYGGRELIYTDYGATLDIQRLVDAAALSIIERDRSNAARNIKRWCQELGLNLINGGLGVITRDMKMEESSASTIYNIIAVVLDSSQCIHFDFAPAAPDGKAAGAVANQRVEVETIRNPQWDALYDRCEVFRDFLDGVDVHNDVTWFVLTNLLRLEGGEAKFFEGLQARQVYNLEKWKQRVTYYRNRPCYLPSYKHIAAWYPDATEAAQAKNIVEAAKLPRGAVQQIEEIEGEPVEVVYERAKAYVLDALQSELGTVTLIRADTGVGKTKIIIDEITAPAIVAVPTHELKNQLADRFRAAGKEVLVSPELPKSLTDVERSKLDRYYAVGAQARAILYLRDLAQRNEEVAEYLRQLSRLKTRHAIILTTHARLPFLDSPIQTVVVDEDILPALYPVSSVRRKDFVLLVDELRPRKGFGTSEEKRHTKASIYVESLLHFIDDQPEQMLTYYPGAAFGDIDVIEDTLKEIEAKVAASKSIASNILGFLDCRCFIRHGDTIRYITRHDLPRDKRYIVLSATLNRQLYERAFDNVVYRDTGRARLKGELIQYPQYSFSRSSLNDELNKGQREKRLSFVDTRLAEDHKIITFKDFRSLFGEKAIAHFGGLVGLDNFSGENIAIIGTPHINPEMYILFAGALDVQLRLRDVAKDSLEWQEVCRNGYRFWFYAYPKRSALHEIQLYFIESEIVQAVGRARLVRNDCQVIVFSNYPVPGAMMAA